MAAPSPDALVFYDTFGRVHCEPGWELTARWWRRLSRINRCDLWFVWKGSGQMTLQDGASVELKPGRCFCMRPGRRYEARQDPRDRLGVTFIHFSYSGHSPRHRRALPPEHGLVPDVAYADRLLARVVALLQARDHTPAAFLFHGFLRDFVQGFPGAGGASGPSPEPDRRLRAVAQHVAEEPGYDWTIARMAEACSMSADHFTRRFRAACGQTPRRYVIERRIERARHLLSQSDLPVARVADALGYRDVFYFSRQFRAEVGLTPTRYRQNLG